MNRPYKREIIRRGRVRTNFVPPCGVAPRTEISISFNLTKKILSSLNIFSESIPCGEGEIRTLGRV